MEHYTLIQYGLFAAVLVVVGIFAGFSGSFFGVGGGTVLVPSLLVIYSFFDLHRAVDMHQAVGASLMLIIANTVPAARSHYRAGNLSLHYFKRWAVWLTLGAVLGGITMAYVSSFFLKVLFTTYLVAAIVYGVFKKSPNEKEMQEARLPEGFIKSAAGIIFGGLSLLLGMAGGPFTTPFFTFFNYPLKKAMALSMAGGIIIGFLGSIAAISAGWSVPHRLPLSLGYINILSVALVAPFMMLSAPWGVHVANHLSEKHLQRWYLLFLIVLVIYMLLQLTTHL